MSDNNLKLLLEYLLEDGIFGKSFNDPNKIKPIQRPPEKNTSAENRFIDQLDKWYNSHLVSRSLGNFAETINELIPQIKAGMYPELKPDPGVVYRGIKVNLPTLLELLGLESINLEPEKAVSIDKPGVLTPRVLKYYPSGKEISSWSTSYSEAIGFATVVKGEVVSNENISVVYVARTDNPANSFIINPKKMKKTYNEPITRYENEDEVLAVGPVNYTRVIIYNSQSHEDTTLDTIRDFKKKIINEAAKDLSNELKKPSMIDLIATINKNYDRKRALDLQKEIFRPLIKEIRSIIMNVYIRNKNQKPNEIYHFSIGEASIFLGINNLIYANAFTSLSKIFDGKIANCRELMDNILGGDNPEKAHGPFFINLPDRKSNKTHKEMSRLVKNNR